MCVPAAQIGLMYQALVVEKRWISEARFLHALNYCVLLPGPEAQQMAVYIGWLLHGAWGGIVARSLFVLPAFALLVSLAWGYMQWLRYCIGSNHWWLQWFAARPGAWHKRG